MNSLEIECVLKHVAPMYNVKFLGCVSVDTLPKSFGPDSCVVVNTSESHRTGSHWICIFQNIFGELSYFDSFALPPRTYDRRLQQFIEKYDCDYWYAKRVIQQPTSNVCGFHVIYFLILCIRGCSAELIMRTYSDHSLKQNDTMVMDFFNHHFTHYVCQLNRIAVTY